MTICKVLIQSGKICTLYSVQSTRLRIVFKKEKKPSKILSFLFNLLYFYFIMRAIVFMPFELIYFVCSEISKSGFQILCQVWLKETMNTMTASSSAFTKSCDPSSCAVSRVKLRNSCQRNMNILLSVLCLNDNAIYMMILCLELILRQL